MIERTPGPPPSPTGASPYVRPMSRRWLWSNASYRAYTLRSVTSVFLGAWLVWIAMGCVALSRGDEAWRAWLAVERHPGLWALHLLALGAAVHHAISWFLVAPKALPAFWGRRRLNPRVVASAQIGLWLLLSAALVAALLWVGEGVDAG